MNINQENHMNQQTAVAEAAPRTNLAEIREAQYNTFSLEPQALQNMMVVADMMAKATITVPQHFRGKPADCMAVVMQAVRWRMDPFVVASKTHVTQGGILGYEAQLINAVINASGAVCSQPEYEFIGDWSKILGKVKEMTSDKGGKYYVATWDKKDEDGLGVVCRATLQGEAEPRSVTTMMSQAYPRFSTQWATDPQQQISYLVTRKFSRRYCPGAIMGVYTPEELSEVREREVEGEVVERKTGTERLKQAATGAATKPTGPALVDVMAKIGAMITKDERKAALDLAKTLTDPADSGTASKAYAARLEWLKANPPAKASEAASAPISAAGEQNSGPATIDNDTGEISGKSNAPPVMAYAQVEEALNKAATRDSFDVACDLIQYVADLQQREELGGIVKKRLAEFKAQ